MAALFWAMSKSDMNKMEAFLFPYFRDKTESKGSKEAKRFFSFFEHKSDRNRVVVIIPRSTVYADKIFELVADMRIQYTLITQEEAWEQGYDIDQPQIKPKVIMDRKTKQILV